MEGLPVLLASAHLIGWTLIHFAWQGTLLGLVYAIVRAVLPRGEARYRCGMAMLFACALCPLLTMWHLLQAEPVALRGAVGAAVHAMASPGGRGGVAGRDAGIDALLPWLVLAWSVGVALLSLRAWRQWRGLKALIRAAEVMPAWQARVSSMAKRFNLRRPVGVLCSQVIATPALVGWIRPVILLPVAVACQFPAAQVELILAHELAHLRRWDPLANLFQVALETLHFYHPVVHWISRDVRNEREICCDSMALSVSGGSRHAFVEALAELGELRERHGSLLLAASGGVLLDRVQYLVAPREDAGRARTSARFAAVALAALLGAVTLQLEWKQAQLQRGIGDSIVQLRSLLAHTWLPLAQPAIAWHPADLTLANLTAPLPVLASVKRDAPTGLWHAGTGLAPRPAQLHIADLAIDIAAASAPVVEPVAPLATTPVPVVIRQPVYPRDALVHGVEGRVVVEFALAANGSVRNPRVVSARPEGVFEQAALDAMQGWKYSVPAGSPAHYRQVLAFTLNGSGGRAVEPATGAEVAIQAQGNCQFVTGTHICRPPDEATSLAGAARPVETGQPRHRSDAATLAGAEAADGETVRAPTRAAN